MSTPYNALEDIRPLLEEKMRTLILDALAELKVFYRGDPGPFLRRDWMPAGMIYTATRRFPLDEEGYGAGTGIESYVYDGYVAIEVVQLDTAGLMPGPDRRADLPSYTDAQRLGTAALAAVYDGWGFMGDLTADPVTSPSGAEQTQRLAVDDVVMGLADRGENNWSNRASFDFRVFTQRLLHTTWAEFGG
jgi:hypothetical protein